MSKKCAKCEKTVYPTEELRCLDKVWHKFCFKCWECGMTLNMKNYKGYDKKPYCVAHYPTTKFTSIADTPEMNRLAQNTKLQSQLNYHAEFEKEKGKYTSVTDDPETRRLLENQQKISSVKYHEEFEKSIKGHKMSVTDEPEQNRLKKNQAMTSNIEYHGMKQKHAEMEQHRGQLMQDPRGADHPRGADQPRGVPVMPTGVPVMPTGPTGGPTGRPTGGPTGRPRPPSVEEATPSPYQARQQTTSTTYNSQGKVEQQTGGRRVGSITDYDPINDRWGSLNTGYAPSSSAYGKQEWEETIQAPPSQQPNRQPEPASPPPPSSPPPSHQPGAVPVMLPVNQPVNVQVHHPQQEQQQPAHYPPPAAQPVQQAQPAKPQGPRYQAQYDYQAQDEDEVGFNEGDLIIDSEPIDEGWMFGTVQRTGKRGMLPANYVEKLQ